VGTPRESTSAAVESTPIPPAAAPPTAGANR
jgi:hypothetical protein